MYFIRKNWFSARVAKAFSSSGLKSILIFFVTHYHTKAGLILRAAFIRLYLSTDAEIHLGSASDSNQSAQAVDLVICRDGKLDWRLCRNPAGCIRYNARGE